MHKLNSVILLIVAITFSLVFINAVNVASVPQALDIVILIDSSGSTADRDPEALRIQAAEFLLDYVQAVGEVQGVTHRFAAANFNTDTLDEIPWTWLLGDAGRDQLIAQSEGGTDFAPALEYALSLRENSNANRPMAVFLFTDGTPDPADDLEVYFNELESTIQELQASGAHIFVVAVGDEAAGADEYWENTYNSSGLLQPDRYERVTEMREIFRTYRQWLADLLGLSSDKQDKRFLDVDGDFDDTTQIRVDAYLEQLVVSVFPDSPQTEVLVEDAAGDPVSPAREGGSVYVRNAPWPPGTWRVTVTGDGAQVWVDRRYATLQLQAPEAPQDLREPVSVAGWLIRSGVVIEDDPDLTLSVDAIAQDGARQSLLLTRKSGGRYDEALKKLTVAGTYSLTLSAEWSGQPVGARQTTPVTVSLHPVPSIVNYEIEGDLIASQAITVTAVISHADRIGPETDTLVQISPLDGSMASTFDLRPDTQTDDGVYVARFTLSDTAGLYRLVCKIQGTSSDGVSLDAVSDATRLDVHSPASQATETPRATSTPRLTPTGSSGSEGGNGSEGHSWWFIGLLTIIIVILAIFMLWYWPKISPVHKEREILRAKRARLVPKVNALHRERNVLRAKRARLAPKVNALHRERNVLRAKRARLAPKVWQLWRQRNKEAQKASDAVASLVTLRTKRNEAERERDEERRRRKKTEQERDEERRRRKKTEQERDEYYERWERVKQSTERIREELRREYERAKKLLEDPSQQQELRDLCDHALKSVEIYEEGQIESIVEDIRRILKIRIEKASGDAEDQLNQICIESHGTRGTARLKALSNYLLKDRWTGDPEQAVKELYYILEQGGSWKLLSLIGSTDLGVFAQDTESVLQDIESVLETREIAQTVSKILVDVLSASEKRFEQGLDEIVAIARDGFDSAIKKYPKVDNLFEDSYSLWSYLLELTEQLEDSSVALPVSEAPELSDDAIDIWGKIIESTEEAFASREKSQWLQALDELKEYGTRLYGQARKLPEGRVLIALAEGWHNQIQNQKSGQADIEIELAPILSIDDVSPAGTIFAVKITNEGKGPASSVEVEVTGIEKTYSHTFESIRRGEIVATDRIFAEENAIQVKVNLKYTSFVGGRREVALDFCLADLKRFEKIEKDFENPYVREDRPLKKGDPFVGERRERVLQKIKRKIKNQSGMVDNLWGIRRIGKTSLIYRLLDDVRDHDIGCVSVYIKSTIFDRRETPWSAEGFLKALAKLIEKRLVESGILHNYGIYERCFGSEDPTAELHNNANKAFQEDFVPFILRRIQEQDKKLLLIFDDADMFGERLYSVNARQFPAEEFNKVLETFYNLAYPAPMSPQGFFVIFVTDISVKDLWRGEAKVSGEDIRLEMLEKGDMKKLLSWGNLPFEYSELAEEYIWQVTGGHPGLIQLVCGEVVNVWVHEENKYHKVKIIPLTLVRKVVRSLTENAHLSGYYRYIYHYSIPEPASATMKYLINQEGIVDPVTLEINYSQLPEEDRIQTKKYLKNQQVVYRKDDYEEKWFLRVGFFYLGRNVWLDR
jgi:hypothetical protein